MGLPPFAPGVVSESGAGDEDQDDQSDNAQHDERAVSDVHENYIFGFGLSGSAALGRRRCGLGFAGIAFRKSGQISFPGVRCLPGSRILVEIIGGNVIREENRRCAHRLIVPAVANESACPSDTFS